jgi:hypothetical protein
VSRVSGGGALPASRFFAARSATGPEELLRIARRFNAGWFASHSAVPSGLGFRTRGPGVETPGYFRVSLRDKEQVAVLILESPAGFRWRNLFVSENALTRA